MNRCKQHGFTLLEISIAMLIMLALAAASTRALYLRVDKSTTEHTAAEVWSIGEYAQRWVQENGEWPNEINSCANAISTMRSITPDYEFVPTESPWGTNYITVCTPASFSIQVQLVDDWAPALMNMLAVTRILPGTTDTTITTLPLPGSIAALSNVLKRTADPAHPEYNRMETDLDMDWNDIKNVGRLDVNYITTSGGMQTHGTIKAGSSAGGSSFAIETLGGDSSTGGVIINPTEPASPNGSIKMNDSYLNSIGGWLSTRLPNMVEKQSFEVYGGDLVPKPECLDGTVTSTGIHVDATPRIKVHPAEGNYATDYGPIDDKEYWEVFSSSSAELNADVYCYYPPLTDELGGVISASDLLNDFLDGGNLVVNNLSGAWAFYNQVVYVVEVGGNGFLMTQAYFPRDTWVAPVYTEEMRICNTDPMEGGETCTNHSHVYNGYDAPPIATVTNPYSDKYISLDISVSLDVNTDDWPIIQLIFDGDVVHEERNYRGDRGFVMNSTIVVDPGKSGNVTLRTNIGGSRYDYILILSSTVTPHVHFSPP